MKMEAVVASYFSTELYRNHRPSCLMSLECQITSFTTFLTWRVQMLTSDVDLRQMQLLRSPLLLITTDPVSHVYCVFAVWLFEVEWHLMSCYSVLKTCCKSIIVTLFLSSVLLGSRNLYSFYNFGPCMNIM